MLFWLAAIAAIFSYFIYPVILRVNRLRTAHRLTLNPNADQPSVSLIVTAYNEEARIEQKIHNTLAIQYNRERLELIVASDCSDDGTDEIVGHYADQGVRLVRASERLGKENAQRTAIAAATGEILVFSDVWHGNSSRCTGKISHLFFQTRRWAPFQVKIDLSARTALLPAKALTLNTKCIAQTRIGAGRPGRFKRLVFRSAQNDLPGVGYSFAQRF